MENRQSFLFLWVSTSALGVMDAVLLMSVAFGGRHFITKVLGLGDYFPVVMGILLILIVNGVLVWMQCRDSNNISQKDK